MGYSIAILAVTFALMWVLLVLPRQRLERAQRDVAASLQVGDRVITSAGIHGVITALDDDTAGVEVAPGTVLTVARLAIHRRTEAADATSSERSAETDAP